MPRIQKLPDLLVNKIAAGEVIERPASVVKELLENALDAGAGRIQLHVEEGGRKLIRVVDNGCGIAAEDLELAVRPHATSKVSTEDDLYRIRTMGFRGEALASVGAVSYLKVLSRTPEAIEGAVIYVTGDRMEFPTAAGCAPGTTVEVRDLFFNVPARRKFLRGADTEFGHIQEQLARIALPNPGVEFELLSGPRSIRQLPPCRDALQRITAFYGEELAAELIPIRRAERGLSIDGYAARPAQSRATGRWQYIFLNGRFIRDRFIQHAIKEAYRGLMDPSRYPVVFLSLTIDPAMVDVNVHPTKIEVRWQDSNVIYSQVLSALRDTFLRSDLTPSLATGRSSDEPTAELRMAERQRIAEFFKQLPSPYNAEPGGGGTQALSPTGRQGSVSLAELAIQFQSAPSRVTADQDVLLSAAPLPAQAVQLHRTYLVTETEEGMIIIDQHALHERILYEQLKNRIASGTLESQRLLIPETLDVSPDQITILQNNHQLLDRLGIEITLYGERTIAVQSFPSILRRSGISEFMRDLLDRLGQEGVQPHTEVLIHEVLDMMACKAAVKAGDPLTSEEIQGLMDQRHLVEKSSNCPHGRPTTLRFSLADLERQFKRT